MFNRSYVDHFTGNYYTAVNKLLGGYSGLCGHTTRPGFTLKRKLKHYTIFSIFAITDSY